MIVLTLVLKEFCCMCIVVHSDSALVSGQTEHGCLLGQQNACRDVPGIQQNRGLHSENKCQQRSWAAIP